MLMFFDKNLNRKHFYHGNMALDEIEKKQLEFLEDGLQEEIDIEKLWFHSGKRQVGIKDTDLFNRMAKAFGVTNVHKNQHAIFYTMNFPEELSNRSWSVHLFGTYSREEFEKYEEEYNVI